MFARSHVDKKNHVHDFFYLLLIYVQLMQFNLPIVFNIMDLSRKVKRIS